MTLPARLRLWPTAEQLRRMARHPAAYAPTAAEVLAPGPVPLPTVPMGAVERALMDTIIGDPDADEPRLRFADWVERGDPDRAAFIREQISHPLSASERGPGGEVFKLWGARDVVFRRGFAEAMSLTGRSFISLSDGLFAATPLREVRLIAVNFLLAELVKCPNLSKLKRLDLRGNGIDPAGRAMLTACPWLEGVAVLM
jgi:uncharacterized protein (TIGR02996 family)